MRHLIRSAFSGLADTPSEIVPETLAMAPVGSVLKVLGTSGRLSSRASQVLRRRRKLWELSQRMFCPLVGTCLTVADMRRLLIRSDFDPLDMSDYELHVQVVAACCSRTPLTEAIQRHLEKRHAAAVARSLKIRGEAALMEEWFAACASGEDLPGTLWACLTHADLGDSGWERIEGDVHMLSHQVGATVRADLNQLARLREDRQQLRNENADLRRDMAFLQRQMDGRVAELQKRLLEAEMRAALLGRREIELAEARRQAGDYGMLVERTQVQAKQIERLEVRNADYAARVVQLEKDVETRTGELLAAEAALASLLGICEQENYAESCGRSCPAGAQLTGRCVLCIGGRANMVDGYRRLVETQGGRFLHHDGGLEESLHRIDAAVATADAVVCQTACVSHAAYWRLKDACKKLGKPCVFLKSPGVTSFARGLANLASHPEMRTPH